MGGEIRAFCRAYAGALLSGDEVAEVVIREAIDARLTTAEIDEEIIAPALWLVGELWERGEHAVISRRPRASCTRSPSAWSATSCARPATTPGGGDRAMISIHEVQQRWRGAGFVVGGRGLGPRLRSQPGIEVCRRVSEAVEAVDAMVKRAHTN